MPDTYQPNNRVAGNQTTVVGLDVSENMLAETRRALRIPLIRASAENLPVADASVDYVLTRNDIKLLEAAHVSRPVMDALFAASDDFAGHYNSPGRVHVYAGPGYPTYYGDPYYGDGVYPYYYPYGGGVSVEVGGPGYYGHYHHWR